MASPPAERIDARPPLPGLRSDIAQAVKDSGSVGLGAFPMGVAFGVLVVHSGLDWWWASVFSSLIFAGSLEFLLIGLVIVTAPLTQIALTSFLVNFRHVFYALSFPLHRVRGKAAKAYSTFALTDEAYAVTAGEAGQSFSGRRILWLQVFIQFYWVGGATTGALLGSVIPAQITGLDFAVTALFTVLAIDAFRARRDLPTPVLALVCALIARFALPGQMLLAAFLMFTAGLMARYAVTRKQAARA